MRVSGSSLVPRVRRSGACPSPGVGLFVVWLQTCPCSCGRTIRNPSPMFPKETPIGTLVHQIRLGWDYVFGLSLGPPSGQADLCSCLFRKSHATASVPELVSVYLLSPRSAEPLKDSFRLLSWFPPLPRSHRRLELKSSQQCVPSIGVLERLNIRGLPQQRSYQSHAACKAPAQTAQ